MRGTWEREREKEREASSSSRRADIHLPSGLSVSVSRDLPSAVQFSNIRARLPASRTESMKKLFWKFDERKNKGRRQR